MAPGLQLLALLLAAAARVQLVQGMEFDMQTQSKCAADLWPAPANTCSRQQAMT